MVTLISWFIRIFAVNGLVLICVFKEKTELLFIYSLTFFMALSVDINMFAQLRESNTSQLNILRKRSIICVLLTLFLFVVSLTIVHFTTIGNYKLGKLIYYGFIPIFISLLNQSLLLLKNYNLFSNFIKSRKEES